ncbi:hypothetical protein RBB77_02990 [Tunturibacter psychrotolerans]|uniref:Uncharacterized protein n=1 Tax=Tunturiibacter psychrotolerans TaxID=3069686 RepID=A0AAU7ZSI6_9BACT
MASKAQIIVKKITTLLDSLVAELEVDTPTTTGDIYRISPGGPLNERGVAELKRLFEEGVSSAEIALRMDISLSGVAKRRSLWGQGKPLKAAFRYGQADNEGQNEKGKSTE